MNADKPDFMMLNHTADLGIVVRGKDVNNLFEDAALAMMQTVVNIRGAVKTKTIRIAIDGQDLAELMVRWLGEILYLFEGEKEVVTVIKIGSVSPTHLDATLESVPFDPALHEILCEIKAVTYHQIEVAKKGDHWEARVFFDV